MNTVPDAELAADTVASAHVLSTAARRSFTMSVMLGGATCAPASPLVATALSTATLSSPLSCGGLVLPPRPKNPKDRV